jgi:hypothetical protein
MELGGVRSCLILIVTEVFSFTVRKNCGLLRHVVWFLL